MVERDRLQICMLMHTGGSNPLLSSKSVLWGDYNTAVSVAPCDGVYLGSIPSGHTKEHFFEPLDGALFLSVYFIIDLHYNNIFRRGR